LYSFTGFAAFAWQDIALVNPHFDTNNTKGRMCFRQAIVNIGTQGMQRNFPLDLFLRASDFRSTQTPTNNDPDAFGIGTHRLLHRLLHGAAERDTLLQLFSNAAPNQVGVQFGLANLHDIQAYTLFGFTLEHGTQFINFFPALPNNNTGLRGMYRN
jgi:hypothetical protein